MAPVWVRVLCRGGKARQGYENKLRAISCFAPTSTRVHERRTPKQNKKRKNRKQNTLLVPHADRREGPKRWRRLRQSGEQGAIALAPSGSERASCYRCDSRQTTRPRLVKQKRRILRYHHILPIFPFPPARPSTRLPTQPNNDRSHLSKAARPRQGRRRRRQRPVPAAVAPERVAVRGPHPGSARPPPPVGGRPARHALTYVSFTARHDAVCSAKVSAAEQ